MSLPLKKVDKNSPEYWRGVAKVVTIVMVLGLLGGGLLAYKITQAEEARAAALASPDKSDADDSTKDLPGTSPGEEQKIVR